jgi:hypothetical protein
VTSNTELGVKNGAIVGEDVDTCQLSHGLNSTSDSGTFGHGTSTPEIGDLVGTDGDLGADSVPHDGEFLLDELLRFTGASVEETNDSESFVITSLLDEPALIRQSDKNV